MENIHDLIDALEGVQQAASENVAWTDDDGEPTLNSFADSGVGGDRSLALREPISAAQSLSHVLEFTQSGRLHRNDVKQLERAGFKVEAGEKDYVVVTIPPTQEAIDAAEDDEDLPEPEPMTLILINEPEDR